MKKKSIIIILVILILIIFIGYMISTNQLSSNEQKNKFKVGNTTFDLPTGYHEENYNMTNDTKITNGTNALFLSEFSNSNVSYYIQNYLNINKNESIESANFTIDNINVYKFTNNNTGSHHIWFVKNNKTYSIYTWGSNNKIDSITFDLIQSLKN